MMVIDLADALDIKFNLLLYIKFHYVEFSYLAILSKRQIQQFAFAVTFIIMISLYIKKSSITDDGDG